MNALGPRSDRPLRLGERLRGAAGFIPGALTVGNMLAGYASILLATEGRFQTALVMILVAGVLDGLDGRVARITRTTSDLGGHLDSLADAVSFAVAPSMLAYHLGVETLGRTGWAACFLYAACGVIRLARFNASPPKDPRYFIGLPIPAAAWTIITPVLYLGDQHLPKEWVALQAGLMVIIALLMISPVRFRTFKDLRFGRKAYRVLALWAAILAGIVAAHEWVIPALLFAYLLSPVVERVWKPREQTPPGTEEDEEEVRLDPWPEDE